MSTRLRNGLLALGGAIILFTSVVVATRSRRSPAPVHSASISESAAPSASAPQPERLPPGLNFVFDCAAFAPALESPCGAPPAAETTLLNLVNSYRVSAAPCSSWPAELYEGAEAALASVAKLDPRQLAPLDRALLQNAALQLLSCRSTPAVQATSPVAKKGSALTQTARTIIAKFALSPDEISKLPESGAVIAPWLGDGAAWKRGADPRFFHTASDGFARAHRQLQQGETLADVVRLVLVNKLNAPYVSDVVQRIVLRRTQPDGIDLCIAELDPSSASCGSLAVRPISQERGARVLPGPPPCVGCHSNNTVRSSAFGPDTGFALADASTARITAALKPLLAH